jgi:signal transduction histidine kinase
MSNLLGNAVKFVPAGQRPHVRIGWDRTPGGARLWVQDNGIGIAPEYHYRLFGMFERMHPDRKFDGTGIGLAIVRKAVERMNGTVGVISDGKAGCRFWIELPVPPDS